MYVLNDPLLQFTPSGAHAGRETGGMILCRAFYTLAGLVLLLIPAIGLSQSSLKGTVRDSVSRETLVGANIHLTGTAIGGVIGP